MKRRIAALLISCLAVLSAGGCAGSDNRFTPSDNKDASVHLSLALRDGTYADVIADCVVDFENKYNVACDIYRLSEDELHAAILDDAESGAGAYDLCMVDGSWMQEYTSAGVLAKLNAYGYELDNDIIPATTEICFRDGDTYLAPYYGNVTVLLYNKSIIKRAGYEPSDIQSVADMKKICEFAKKTHNLGFMYRGDTENNIVVDFLPVLLAYGGWVVDENNQPSVDTVEFHDAMAAYLDLIATGKPAGRDELVIAVANNAAAMAIGWPGWYTPEPHSTADYIAMPGRMDDDGAFCNASVYGIWTLGVPISSQQPKLAVSLLSYLMDKDVQYGTVASGGVPCRYSSLKDEAVLAQFPEYKAVCTALEEGVYRPIIAYWPQFYTILGAHMRDIIEGGATIDEGLAAAQQELLTITP